jgi:hypothetical protein
MGQVQSRNGGFRITGRYLLILYVYLVILLRVIVPGLRALSPAGTWHIGLATLLVSLPLLASLVVAFDRPGPLKNWAVSFLIFLLYPAIALNHDLAALSDYLARGTRPALWTTLLLNLAIIPPSVFYARRLVPRACPGCRRRTLIPLMRLFKEEERSAKTCWCASCGGKYWKDQEGNWRVERRRTWMDGPQKAPAQPLVASPPVGRPEAQVPMHCPLPDPRPTGPAPSRTATEVRPEAPV